MSGRQFDKQINRLYRKRFGGNAPAEAAPSAAAADDRKAEIAELAAAVADEHCPIGPVAPAAIAEAKGITTSFGPYGDAFDGMLEHAAGRFHIYGNLDRLERPDSPRARFTLAHELGHYFIDEHRLALAAGRAPAHRSQSEYESPSLVEQEADHFAANLLMPGERFMARAKAAQPGLSGILEVAQAMGASVTAAALRYVALDVRPSAVVKWDWRGYAWKSLSDSTFRACFRRTFEFPSDLAADSPTRRALARQVPLECGFFEAATVASAWFSGIAAGQWRDVIFIEQAIPLGRFGVLTFLHPEGGARGLPRGGKGSPGR